MTGKSIRKVQRLISLILALALLVQSGSMAILPWPVGYPSDRRQSSAARPPAQVNNRRPSGQIAQGEADLGPVPPDSPAVPVAYATPGLEQATAVATLAADQNIPAITQSGPAADLNTQTGPADDSSAPSAPQSLPINNAPPAANPTATPAADTPYGPRPAQADIDKWSTSYYPPFPARGMPGVDLQPPWQASPMSKINLAGPGDVPLQPGWNLVSIPKAPLDSDPAAVLSSIAGSYSRVFAYDNCDPADPWKLYDPADPGGSDLAAIDHRLGLWVEMTATDVLTVSGAVPATTTIPLCSGWNLIGHPFEQSYPPAGVLNAIAGQYLRLFTYDPTDPADLWAGLDVLAPAYANDLPLMDPGGGYWVLATTNTTLTLTVDDTPPIVVIDAPIEDTELLTQTNVLGTASDENLSQYVVAYALANSDQFTSIVVSTTSVTDGLLGVLDTTLLPNGLTQLRVTATDLMGNSTSVTRNVQVTGENKPGMFTITYTDLEIPVAGIPIKIKRTYDSRERGYAADFGYGWRLEVQKAGIYVNNRPPGEGWAVTSGGGIPSIPCIHANELTTHITEVRFSDVEFYQFAFQVQMSGYGSIIAGGCLGAGQFIQIGGVPGATLDIVGNREVLWQNGASELLDFTTFQVYEPEDVLLTTIDGQEYELDLLSGLTRIGDSNGNSLFISEGGVVHSSGKSISFIRDAGNRIIGLTDPLGNTLSYEYDAAGDLTAVTDRGGNTTTFGYEANHFLSAITDPLGNVPLRNEYDASGRLVAQVDADGNRLQLDVDLTNNTTSVTDRLNQVTILQYNAAGLITQAEANGVMIQSTYDERGNQTSETNALGDTKTFTYDENDYLTGETDFKDNAFSYSYDSTGHLTGLTDPDNNSTTFTYDAGGNVTEIRNADNGLSAAFDYDGSGNLTELSALGSTTNLSYDSFGNVVTLQTAAGLTLSATYDANGRLLTKTVNRTVDGTIVNETTSFTYDPNGNLLSIQDPLGNLTTFTYNAAGQKISETDANNHTTTFEYDLRGNLSRINYPDGTYEAFGYDQENRQVAQTDRAQRTTFFEYDSENRLERTTFPDGSELTYTYDVAGNLIAASDGNGHTTTFTYDENGQVLTTTDPLGNTISNVYNDLGVRISATDPLSNVTQFEYDGAHFAVQRITQTTFADGTTNQVTYDVSGRIASRTDEALNTTAFDYDAAGNLVQVTDPMGGETYYVYDEVGNLISQTDANNHTTTFEYDAFGNMVRRTLPLGMFETFTYDGVGNLLTHIDFNGDLTTFEYDSVNRVISKTLPDGSQIDYTYTPTGQLSTITDALGVTQFDYDLRDRVVQIDYPNGDTLDYSYDAVGNRTSVTSAAGTTTYAYDDANRLIQVTDPQSEDTTYVYDAAGNLTTITYPSGVATHYFYDVRHRLQRVEHIGSDGSTLLARYEYTLGPAGNRMRLVELNGRTVDYTYDDLYRLTQETDTLTGSSVITTYTYDNVGNRLAMDRDGAVTTYSYDDNDRLLAAGGQSFTYDNNGNMLTQTSGSLTDYYEYDDNNRLIRHIGSGGTTTYVYDAAGNRVSQDHNGVVTEFIVDPLDGSGLAQVLFERDGAGLIMTNYVYGHDLISLKSGADKHFYHPDGTASIRFLSDDTGAISDTYDFDAFGNLLASNGITPNHYLFHGQQFDPNLGFYYLRARYMSPEHGRFLSIDPFSGSIYDPLSLHKYSFAHNDPVNKSDPTGLFTLGSVNISVSVQTVLVTAAVVFNAFQKEIEDLFDKLETLHEEIPRLKLNEELPEDQLRFRVIRIRLEWFDLSIDLDRSLGGGAVAKAYDVAAELGGTGGNIVAFFWSYSAGKWLTNLPQVDDKPAHYLSCHFNGHVARAYSLTLISDYAVGSFSTGLQVVGVYLSYINFLTLMAETMEDFVSGQIPLQPPGGICPIPN